MATEHYDRMVERAAAIEADRDRFHSDVDQRRRELTETFTAWYDDPRRIAKLLLWLGVKKEAPRGVQATADFVANASTWESAYQELCELERAFDQ